jgi:phosphate transport system protein
LKILALYHPVANDLRRVAVVMKITAELERVADLAVSIAERSAGIALYGEFPMPARLAEMTREALSMLHDSIDAFVEQNAAAARKVCQRDEHVDNLNSQLIDEVVVMMKQRPDLVEPGLHLFSVIRHVERVADHATNISEDVVYLVEGAIIRHPRLHRRSGASATGGA